MTPIEPDSSSARRLGVWPTWVAVAVLWTLTLLGQYWVFALLFLAWGMYDLASGESHFIQRIPRSEKPLTFWLVASTWILMSVLWLAYPG